MRLVYEAKAISQFGAKLTASCSFILRVFPSDDKKINKNRSDYSMTVIEETSANHKK